MKMKAIIAVLALFPCLYAAVLPDVLVTAGNPSRLEITAAEELKYFLEQITKTPIKIIPEENFIGGNAIYLGQTAFAASKLGENTFAEEEWLFKTVGGSLIISGGRPAGTLYGVYALLEKLGVAFLTPDATVLPAVMPQDLQFDERNKPAFAGRLIFDGYSHTAINCKASKQWKERYTRFLLRSRINGTQSLKLPSEYTGRLLNICHSPQWHTLGLFVDRKLFDLHPEYFPMDDFGRRFPPVSLARGANLCVSNPEVIKATLDSLRKMIQRNRQEKPREEWSEVFDISVLDNAPFLCKCPTCSAISEEEGSECGTWLRYINQVATEIAREYPEIIIRTLIYSAVKNPPTKTMPAANVLCWLCDDFTRSDNFRPLTSNFNSHRFEYFANWKKLNPRLMVWDYWNLGNAYFNPPRIETMIDAIVADLRFFHSLGMEALFYEASKDQITPQNFMDLNYFVAHRLMVDPNQDAEKLIDLFMDGYYGNAAPLLRTWLGKLRKSIDEYPQFQNFTTARRWQHMTGLFMVETLQTFRAAEALVPEGSPERQRVRSEMISPMAAIIVNRDSFEKELLKAGFDMEQLIADCQEYSRHRLKIFESQNTKYFEKAANNKFQSVLTNLPMPEKFSSLPREDVKFIAYPHFATKLKLNALIVDDPDSQYGKVLQSANPDPLYHGINRLLPGDHKFRSTSFVLGNHRMEGKVELRLTQVPSDEKYHWYKMPGTVVLNDKSYFWGHGWAIQAETSHFYRLTDGTEADNTYECWFSAKFTGPSYVKGSTQKDAICIEAVVALRPGIWPEGK